MKDSHEETNFNLQDLMDLIEEESKESKKRNRERRKLGIPNPDDLFFMPEISIDLDEDEDREESKELYYNKVHEGQDNNPGIKLSKYLKDLTQVKNSESRKNLERRFNMTSSELMEELNSISPRSYDEVNRLNFYICNILLSMRDIAPRRRNMRPTASISIDGWDETVTNFNRDVQIFDLEWIRRKYPDHRATRRFDNLFLHVMKSKEFDYSHAFRVASSNLTAEKKAQFMALTFEMQIETVVIKTKNVKKMLSRIEQKIDGVRLDLIDAATQNPHRGAKLISNLEDRLNIWRSAYLTLSRSPTAMADIYKLLSGEKITPSNFMKKLKSTNEALAEVDSKFLISL
ncbi:MULTISPECIES: hypothetical protein [unclassified Methylophaga]|uniref:hypothetical protein n=1 Tax=unclassified Methylophaga TaxID=2629249 RepID=UPI000C97C101|nr:MULTISPECIES: hypothetical protein [unclassified Methylophaga]MBN46713.1 hypothetical protein [Methylophaga sp.]|tara:strand:- start:5981 stop:7015 length:1035 start_codon:yes stop_codon:yes gene_type:complete